MLRPLRLLARPDLLGGILGGALALVLATGVADARIGLGTGFPQRSNQQSDGRATQPTPITDKNSTNAGFNRKDCYDTEQTWKFVFTDVPATATTVELWARSDNSSCADRLQRQTDPGQTQTPGARCWRIASFKRDDVVLARAVTIKPIQVIQAIDKESNVVDPAELDPAVVCKPKTAGMSPRDVYLHILPMAGSDVVPESATTVPGTTGTTTTTDAVFQTIWDIDGPNPPTGLSLGAGNTLLVANFTNSALAVSDHNGFRAYCFGGTPTVPTTKELDGALEVGDMTDTGAATDDATTDDTGSSDTGTSDPGTSDATSTTTDAGPGDRPSSGCPSGDPFIVGQPPTAELEQYACGTVQATAGTSIKITGLTNYAPYAVAIAAVDRQGNSGALSAVVCGMPKETVDFWGAYKKAGGTGGGGYCAFGQGKSAASALAAAAFGLALLARVGRRFRKPL